MLLEWFHNTLDFTDLISYCCFSYSNFFCALCRPWLSVSWSSVGIVAKRHINYLCPVAKVINFPISSPAKFGFKPVRRKRFSSTQNPAQLNLFSEGKQVRLSPVSVFEEALLLDEQGSPNAKAWYLKAINEGDSVADAYCNLGILESESKNYIQAIDCFTRSLKESPRHFEAHYNLANLYAEIGDFPLAKIHYSIAIEIEPDFPNSHFNLGLILAMDKEIENAILSLMRYRKLAVPEEQSQADELINTLTRTLSR